MVPALLCTDDYSIKFAWAQAVMHICTQPLSIAELRELAAPSQCVQKILVFVDSKSYIADDSVCTVYAHSTYCVTVYFIVSDI